MPQGWLTFSMPSGGGLYSVWPQVVAYIQYALRGGLYSVWPQVVTYIQYALRGGLYSVSPQRWLIFSMPSGVAYILWEWLIYDMSHLQVTKCIWIAMSEITDIIIISKCI